MKQIKVKYVSGEFKGRWLSYKVGQSVVKTVWDWEFKA